MNQEKEKIQISTKLLSKTRIKAGKQKFQTSPRKLKKPEAIISVLISLNNCFLNLTDFKGKTIAKTSAGIFAAGPIKKDSAFAALRAATALANISLAKNIKRVLVFFKGFGKARLSIATGLRSAGLRITAIHQKLSIPHNGCRPRKKRRLLF